MFNCELYTYVHVVQYTYHKSINIYYKKKENIKHADLP